jgi:hypothetical protein
MTLYSEQKRLVSTETLAPICKKNNTIKSASKTKIIKIKAHNRDRCVCIHFLSVPYTLAINKFISFFLLLLLLPDELNITHAKYIILAEKRQSTALYNTHI